MGIFSAVPAEDIVYRLLVHPEDFAEDAESVAPWLFGPESDDQLVPDLEAPATTALALCGLPYHALMVAYLPTSSKDISPTLFCPAGSRPEPWLIALLVPNRYC